MAALASGCCELFELVLARCWDTGGRGTPRHREERCEVHPSAQIRLLTESDFESWAFSNQRARYIAVVPTLAGRSRCSIILAHGCRWLLLTGRVRDSLRPLRPVWVLPPHRWLWLPQQHRCYGRSRACCGVNSSRWRFPEKNGREQECSLCCGTWAFAPATVVPRPASHLKISLRLVGTVK